MTPTFTFTPLCILGLLLPDAALTNSPLPARPRTTPSTSVIARKLTSKRCTEDGCRKWCIPGKEKCREHNVEEVDRNAQKQDAQVNQFTNASAHKVLFAAGKVRKQQDSDNKGATTMTKRSEESMSLEVADGQGTPLLSVEKADLFGTKMITNLETQHVSSPTEYSLGGYTRRALLYKLLFDFPAVRLENHQSELRGLVEELKKLQQPMLDSTARDQIETWLATLELLPEFEGERACRVLETIFSDVAVQHTGLSLAHHCLEEESFPKNALEIFKASLGVHMTKHGFMYTQLCEKEIAYIDRVKDYKRRMVAVVYSGCLALLIGLFNFFSRSQAAFARERVQAAFAYQNPV